MNGLARVTRVDARLVPFRWEWADSRAEEIARHWRARQAAQPAIFNGRVLMMCGARREGDTLGVSFFATDYAHFLACRDWGFPDPAVENGFAMGALVGSDGGYLMGRMAPHTASAGQLYFPCGTPDMSDVGEEGVVDLAGSLTREIVEETGLDLSAAEIGDEWIVVRHEGLVAFMRTVRLPIASDEAERRIADHLAADPMSELSGIEIVRQDRDLDVAAMPGVLPIFFRDAFSAGTAGRPAPPARLSDSRSGSWSRR